MSAHKRAMSEWEVVLARSLKSQLRLGPATMIVGKDTCRRLAASSTSLKRDLLREFLGTRMALAAKVNSLIFMGLSRPVINSHFYIGCAV
jgi:hypothetical protein